MKRLGLIPYGLKFQSQLGRDRCLGDDAVDLLNELMANNFIPRGSFEDWDLQSLAFLEDHVSGNAFKLQLQVVQRLSQLQNVEQPAAVLADLVQEVSSAQAGDHNQTPMSAPDTAGMAPSSYSMSSQHGSQAGLPDFTPYDPFAPESSDGPHHSLADHHSQAPFQQHALPDAHFHPPLPYPAPTDFAAPDFAPSPEPAVEECLPFPCFRYEEELAAALLQNGAVHNVEHLLTVAPGCTMPPEVLDCFQGRWPGDIEGFLMSRPWIFSVSPNHIDVTDNARVGLVYKREVLQALCHALHDKVQLTLGDIAEIGPRLARINDIIADHGGLVKFLSTSLFSEDVELRFFGPGNTRVMLRPHLARGVRPNF